MPPVLAALERQFGGDEEGNGAAAARMAGGDKSNLSAMPSNETDGG